MESCKYTSLSTRSNSSSPLFLAFLLIRFNSASSFLNYILFSYHSLSLYLHLPSSHNIDLGKPPFVPVSYIKHYSYFLCLLLWRRIITSCTRLLMMFEWDIIAKPIEHWTYLSTIPSLRSDVFIGLTGWRNDILIVWPYGLLPWSLIPMYITECYLVPCFTSQLVVLSVMATQAMSGHFQ